LVAPLTFARSHDTISRITDAVAEEVKAWQARPREELRDDVRGRGKLLHRPGRVCAEGDQVIYGFGVEVENVEAEIAVQDGARYGSPISPTPMIPICLTHAARHRLPDPLAIYGTNVPFLV
jgi:hypothetical protein